MLYKWWYEARKANYFQPEKWNLKCDFQKRRQFHMSLPFVQPLWENCSGMRRGRSFLPKNENKHNFFIHLSIDWYLIFFLVVSVVNILILVLKLKKYKNWISFIHSAQQLTEARLSKNAVGWWENLQSQTHWMIKSLQLCFQVGAVHIWKNYMSSIS